MELATLAVCLVLAPQGGGVISHEGQAIDRRGVITRLADGVAPPRLDGRFDEPCWDGVPSIGDFVQVEPKEGLVPGQRTVLRVLHDAEHIYMAIECFDERAEQIRATQRSRDADLEPDDRVEMLIDPFGLGNQAYFLQVGAGGSIGDALAGNASFLKSWDTIWDARILRDPRGWFAEIAIPFRSLAFPDGVASWSFNARRIRRWTNESYRWANARQAVSFFQLTELGELVGIGDVEHGAGVDVVPNVTARQRRQRLSGEDWNDDFDFGSDVFVRLTPSLNAALTYNTDFAQTESDERRINLTRFPLFFPEKRDFFLQDESRFRFGPGRSRFVPFFSRRIGIGDDGEIPIDVGAKVSGQLGGFGVGALGVMTDTGGGNDFRRELGVVRIERSLGTETRLGLIGTIGRPTARGDNRVGGVDVFHREPAVIGDMDLRLWGHVVASRTSGAGGDGAAGGVRFASEGRDVVVEGEALLVGAEFNPELGFVRRRGVQEYELAATWRPRSDSEPVRRWRVGFASDVVLDVSGEVQDGGFKLTPFGLQTHDGDDLRIFVEREYERLDEPFRIFDDIEVGAGEYWETQVGLSGSFSAGRPVSGSVWMSYGDFYDGRGWDSTWQVEWRAHPALILGAQYDQTDAHVAGRSFQSRVAELRADVHLTPRLSIRNLVQFDNASQALGVQSRTRWIVEPGSDLFVVITAGWLRGEDHELRPDAQELALKFAYTVRF